MDWYPVSREMNNVRYENPDLIRPARWYRNCS
jgi:hypothetical protein